MTFHALDHHAARPRRPVGRLRAAGRAVLLSLAALALAAATTACVTEPDENSGPDKDRGGALQVGLGQVITDDLNPDAGDSTDWKSFAVPAPGFLTVQVFWDQSPEIIGAEITVHDKFGAQLARRRHEANIPQDELVVRVDAEYYFVKVVAERGHSIYSLVGRHSIGNETNGGGDGGGGGPVRPDFASNLELGGGDDGSGGGDDGGASGGGGGGGGGASAGGGGAAASGGGGGGEAAAAGGALPVAAGGGAAGGGLPVAAGGGAAGAAAAAPPPAVSSQPIAKSVAVTAGGGGGSAPQAVAPKAASTPPPAPKKAKIKPIAGDCPGDCEEFVTSLRLVTDTGDGSEIKIGSCQSAGAKVGDVGEIYVKGERVDGARFQITKVLKSSCRAVTNAPADVIKDADKIVVKIPKG